MGAKKTSKTKSTDKASEAAEDVASALPAEDSAEQSGDGLIFDVPAESTAESEPETVAAPEETSKSDDAKPKHHSHWQKAVFISFGLVVLTGLLFTRLYTAKTSLNKITIAGVQAGRSIQAKSIEPVLKQKAAQYQIKISHPNAEVKSFSLKEAGLTIDTAATISQARERQQSAPFIHRLQFWRTLNVPVAFKIDDTVFDAFVLAEGSDVSKPAKNANLVIEAGKLKVTPASTGQGYQIKNARQTLLDGATMLQAAPFQMEASEIKPNVPDANLEAAKTKVTSILSQNVSLTINNKVTTVSPAEIGGWIELTPVESDKTIDVTVDSGKVAEYLTALTKPYITGQRAQVVSTQADGSTVILVQGQNGVDVQKKDAVAADIAKKLIAGEGVAIDLPITTAPFKTVTAQAYDKWIAVDVTAKRLYAYEKTNLMRTVLVSAGAPGTPTVLGQYSIYSKFAKQDMRGQNVDGSRYFQPNVPWVNYFYKDYAIHGNYWRPASYFGSINSSHGCVGVQNVDGEWIFNWAPIGTPIIIYN